MPAYVVAYADIHDPDAYAHYREAAGESIAAHGGRFLARGGDIEVLEGDWSPRRVVLIEFADLDAARRWYDSPEYGEAKRRREGAADVRLVLTQGV
jgi:uncharacterized protein (DUF1330 family)